MSIARVRDPLTGCHADSPGVGTDELSIERVLTDTGLQETLVEKGVLVPERSNLAGIHRGTEELVCGSITTAGQRTCAGLRSPSYPSVISVTGRSLTGHIRTEWREGRIEALRPR